MHFGIIRFRRLLFVSCASYAVTNLMDMTDTMIVGHLLGETALGAVGLFWPVVELLCFVSTALASGTAIRYSEAVGQFRSRRSDELFSGGFFAAAIVGLATCAGLWLFREPCFRFFGVGPETLDLLRPYWSWFTLNAALVPVSVYLSTLICADGGGRVCTAAFMAELSVNVVSSYFLCRSFGTAGCALGTVAGTFASLLVLPFHFLSKDNALHFRRVRPMADALKSIAIDFPESGYLLFTGVMYVVMNKILVLRFGDGALPVMAAVITANGLMYFFYGVSKAVQPIVGVYLGEKNAPAVRMVMRDAVRWAVLLGGALSVAIFACPVVPVVLVGIASPAIAENALSAVRIVSISFVFFSISALFTSYWLFIGKSRLSIALVTLQELVCPMVGCALGMVLAGQPGFWTGYMLASPTALALVFGYLALTRMRGDMPFLLAHERDARIFTWDVPALNESEACRIAQEVLATLKRMNADPRQLVRAAMIVEDTLVEACSRNCGRTIDAEVTLDLNDGIRLLFRDGGVVGDNVPAFSADGGFRMGMLGKLQASSETHALVTTGFHRHVINLQAASTAG